MEKRKIFIYENDIKFKKYHQFNLDDVEFADDIIKKKYINKLANTDNDEIKNRLQQAGEIIDLSHLNINNIDGIFTSKQLNECQILFLNDNKLSGDVDFSQFKNLKVIDVTSNKIKTIKLPESLEELTANYNEIKTLQNNLPNLKRLLINYNLIEDLHDYINLELLQITNNHLEIIKSYPRIRKIIANTNPLKYINLQPSLIYLDVGDTLIDQLPILSNLKNLIVSRTKLTSLSPEMKNIEFIDLVGTPINRLSYFENFDTIVLTLNLTKNISSKYKSISNAKINITHGNIVTISKNLLDL